MNDTATTQGVPQMIDRLVRSSYRALWAELLLTALRPAMWVTVAVVLVLLLAHYRGLPMPPSALISATLVTLLIVATPMLVRGTPNRTAAAVRADRQADARSLLLSAWEGSTQAGANALLYERAAAMIDDWAIRIAASRDRRNATPLIVSIAVLMLLFGVYRFVDPPATETPRAVYPAPQAGDDHAGLAALVAGLGTEQTPPPGQNVGDPTPSGGQPNTADASQRAAETGASAGSEGATDQRSDAEVTGSPEVPIDSDTVARGQGAGGSQIAGRATSARDARGVEHRGEEAAGPHLQDQGPLRRMDTSALTLLRSTDPSTMTGRRPGSALLPHAETAARTGHSPDMRAVSAVPPRDALLPPELHPNQRRMVTRYRELLAEERKQ
ncbi:MAG: hypothetical protein KDJ39_09780 [Gammaproteobacteria bacterium]|nr:hypothetical protein [Gammaproteobacteria bacterium]MCP5299753.1 hypothetical protein [Chromatiaceae bacterium]